MKTLLKIPVLSLIFLLVSCSNSFTSNSQSADNGSNPYTVLTPQDYQNAIAKGDVIIVDVRTQQEYANGHINGAINIDYYSSDFKQQIGKLEKDAPIYIYCKSGNRSGSAGKVMINEGFKEIYDLRGGMGYWNGEVVK